MEPGSSKPLTLRQKLFLAVVVPLFMIACVELAARVVLALTKEEPASPTALEMPTWMLNDANAAARRAPSADAVDWLSMFEEGDGYRVRLTPNIRRAVRNTFSLIPADAQRRYEVKANSLGFRGPELSPRKGPDVFRVLVFGDSSSFGWGVEEKDAWSTLLRESLQQTYPTKRIEVGNFAIPGDSSAYGRLLFDHFARTFESDLVILGFGANDAKPVFTSHTDQVARFSKKTGLLSVAKALRYSAMYRLLEKLAAERNKPVPGTRPRKPAVSEPMYAENLRMMAGEAQKLGNKNTLLLTLCTPANYARRARGVARKEHLLFFNGQAGLLRLLPEIQKGSVYASYVADMNERYGADLKKNKLFHVTSDGCHPNELGHRFVADNLTRIVAESGLIH